MRFAAEHKDKLLLLYMTTSTPNGTLNTMYKQFSYY